jgi:lipopolysaccharide export LptBFGC system permease protein LptF
VDTLARYVVRRLAGRFALLLAVFVGVVGGGQIGILLGRGVPPEALMPVVPSMLLFATSIALPLAMTTAVLVSLGGMQQDGEIQALASAGISHRAVVWRLSPVVALGVVGSLVLSHLAMPVAVADIRDHKERFLQAMVATCVVRQQPIITEGPTTVWAGDAHGHRLRDVYFHNQEGQTFTAIYAPAARWTLSERGIVLQLQDVSLIQRGEDGRIVAGHRERWNVWHDPESSGRIGACSACRYEFPRTGPQALPRGVDVAVCPRCQAETRRQVEPDAMSTPRLFAELKRIDPEKERSQFNNARLAMHLRFFLPVSLIAFALFAAGFALVLGTADNLPGVAVVVLLATVFIYPAFGYVKTNVGEPQMDPGWLLWPPISVLAMIGWFMVHRPDRVRQGLDAGWLWLTSRRKAAR